MKMYHKMLKTTLKWFSFLIISIVAIRLAMIPFITAVDIEIANLSVATLNGGTMAYITLTLPYVVLALLKTILILVIGLSIYCLSKQLYNIYKKEKELDD